MDVQGIGKEKKGGNSNRSFQKKKKRGTSDQQYRRFHEINNLKWAMVKQSKFAK